MFIYLSKKISVPNGVPLESLSWNNTDGFIAIGGNEGILKVLKLEQPKETRENRIKGLSAPSNLDMNEPLEGHATNVRLVVWNERFQEGWKLDFIRFDILLIFYTTLLSREASSRTVSRNIVLLARHMEKSANFDP